MIWDHFLNVALYSYCMHKCSQKNMRCFEKLIIYIKHLMEVGQFENLPLTHKRSATVSLTITCWQHYPFTHYIQILQKLSCDYKASWPQLRKASFFRIPFRQSLKSFPDWGSLKFRRLSSGHNSGASMYLRWKITSNESFVQKGVSGFLL